MSQPRHFRLYYRLCAGVIALGLLAVGALNYIVDPKWVWGSAWGPEFLTHRDQLWDRTLKAELLRRARPEVLLIGTSVTESGFDPDHPVWRGRRVFNSGWVSSSVSEIREGLEYAIKVGPPQEVYYFMDFDSFNDNRGPQYHYYESRLNPDLSKTDYYLRAAFGLQSTIESLQLLKKRWDGERVNRYRANGFHASVEAPDQRAVFETTVRGLFLKPHIFGKYESDRSQFREFRQILRICRTHAIPLTLVIIPTHATYLEAIHAAGLWGRFEDWKRRLVLEVDPEASRPPRGGPPALWDFSGYGAMRSASYLSADEGKANPGNWFVDPAHPNAALGARILSEIHKYPSCEGPTNAPLGTQLNSGNMESALLKIREDRRLYLNDHPQDHQRVREILRAVRPPRATQ